MADKHDLCGLYNGLKAIYEPKTNVVGPVLSAVGCQLYTNLEDIKVRWKENFCNLLNQRGAADQSACHKIQQRETREELSDPITDDELQGCVLAPTLFSLYLVAVLETMCTNLN
ncbi:unnamed protein product [Pocillopora meandrina]|uniref:Uncharacterized protein n=1 Tax=Pocillopora meandrina TaxID=46732 RepID=A0AAU9WF16_9CNID|nr:unnamed protein product [Pocillopora meandrina]